MRMELAMAAGMLALASTAQAAETVTDSYGARGRLVQVVKSGGPAGGVSITYSQDAASNRTVVVVTGAPH